MSSIQPALRSRVALVTGATGGIGSAVCRRLAAQGWSICLHYNTDTDTAIDLWRELTETYGEKFGSKFMKHAADMGDYEQIKALHERTVDILGSPLILINNAGTTSSITRPTSIASVPIEAFEATWRTNCGSAYLLTQLCMPFMEASQWGRVIFMSSVAGMTGGIVGPHYASSKSALHALIHWLAGACAGKGVTVNGVAPALVAETKMLPGRPEELAKKIPVGRLGEPDEIAGTVMWMVETGYVTNKIIAVDGGMVPQH